MRFIEQIAKSPLPVDGGRGEEALAAVKGAAGFDAPTQAFLKAVFDGSPFLAHAARSTPDALTRLLAEGPDAAFAAALEAIAAAPDIQDHKRFMAALRKAKLETALTVALADLGGVWPTMTATARLSDAAEASIQAAVAWVYRDGARRGVLTAPDPAGLIVLGMGKLGAQELNYSSDIDLILFYDPDVAPIARPDRMQHEMTRIARSLCQLLDERTRDGYVYRTDLRLRPDPASTPPAITTDAASVYYESMGQNWERAAMIKARPVAGDIAAGEAFLGELRPFIWRRSLDFNAIRDIQSIKRQIDRRGGEGAPSAISHDVKLGRGGIREVEFYAQTQQLIWGGRDASLRAQRTLEALDALVDAGHVEPDARNDLAGAYLTLRDVEHRLQMVDDRQTHVTPDAEGLPAFARFAGFETGVAFAERLVETLETVEARFGALFADEPTLGGEAGGALVFTGGEDHPETIETIRSMGYQAPERVTNAIRAWHHGRVRAARTQRAREILTELTPDLLKRFADAPDPDRAFAALETFVAGLPAGVQFFSLLQANPALMAFLSRILGQSPYLAELIGRRPHVLDAVLTDAFGDPPEDKAGMAEALAMECADAQDLQDLLDGSRRWLNDLRLRLGVQSMEGRLRPALAAAALADAADVVCQRLLDAVSADFAEAHGPAPGAYAVIAYGKWGSRELTVASDLDCVAVYEAPLESRSDGPRPLAAPVYFMRLTQRLVTALTTLTGEGRLFPVDLRLRPSGDDGPIATHFASLETYLRETAWTWELMALSRARAAVGDPALMARVEALRAEVLGKAAARRTLIQDVAEMRARIAESKPAGGPWDVKRRSGGMLDGEFVAEGLALSHGGQEAVAAARGPAEQIEALAAAGALSEAEGRSLADAARFWLEAQWLLRLIGHDEDAGAEIVHASQGAGLASALGVEDYARLTHIREGHAARVAAAFKDHIADQAKDRGAEDA